jgi:hypothetical protein
VLKHTTHSCSIRPLLHLYIPNYEYDRQLLWQDLPYRESVLNRLAVEREIMARYVNSGCRNTQESSALSRTDFFSAILWEKECYCCCLQKRKEPGNSTNNNYITKESGHLQYDLTAHVFLLHCWCKLVGIPKHVESNIGNVRLQACVSWSLNLACWTLLTWTQTRTQHFTSEIRNNFRSTHTY